jgi:hypothetical protein
MFFEMCLVGSTNFYSITFQFQATLMQTMRAGFQCIQPNPKSGKCKIKYPPDKILKANIRHVV